MNAARILTNFIAVFKSYESKCFDWLGSTMNSRGDSHLSRLLISLYCHNFPDDARDRQRLDSRQIYIDLAIQYRRGFASRFRDPPTTRRERDVCKYESRLNNDVSADATPAVSLILHRAPCLEGFNGGISSSFSTKHIHRRILSADFSR